MVMDSVTPPKRPLPPDICMTNYGLMKRTEPGDPPFYAVCQEHTETTVAARKFWVGVAIATADKRRRRFETDVDATREAEYFRTLGIRVDGIVKVTVSGQRLVGWTHFENPPEDPNSGTW